MGRNSGDKVGCIAGIIFIVLFFGLISIMMSAQIPTIAAVFLTLIIIALVGLALVGFSKLISPSRQLKTERIDKPIIDDKSIDLSKKVSSSQLLKNEMIETVKNEPEYIVQKETAPSWFVKLKQQAMKERANDPEWQNGFFLDFIQIAGAYYIQDPEKICNELKSGDKLILNREQENEHDVNAIQVVSNSGAVLGYIPRKSNSILAGLMDSGNILFARLYSKRLIGGHLSISIEVFMERGKTNERSL